MAVAAALLSARAAVAQSVNLIGIYTTPAAESARTTAAANVPFSAYFVLTSPRTMTGEAVTACDGYEFRVVILGEAAMTFRLSDTTHPGWVNDLSAANCADAAYRVHGSTPVPVTNDAVVLQHWSLMMLVNGLLYFYLSPVEAPTVPGLMAFTSPGTEGSTAVGAMPASGRFDFPVFDVNAGPDPVESCAWGAVKSLYR